MLIEEVLIFRHPGLAPVDSQRHRRPLIAGLQYGLITMRILHAEPVYPPLWMGVPSNLGFGCPLQQGCPLTYEIAQYGIDQPQHRLVTAQVARRRYGAVHNGMGGSLAVDQLIE